MRVGAGGIRQCCRGDANGGEAGEQQYIGKDLAYASVCLTSLPSNDRNPETEQSNRPRHDVAGDQNFKNEMTRQHYAGLAY